MKDYSLKVERALHYEGLPPLVDSFNSWHKLDEQDVRELFEHIGPLLADPSDNEMAKRFDALVFDMILAIELNTADQPKLRDKIITVAERLNKKGAVPEVSNKMGLIVQVQEEEFWENISITKLEQIRTELRHLLRFLDKTERPVAYTDFEDEIGEVEEPEIPYPPVNLEQYKKRVERYLKEHKDHLVIDKLYRGEPITEGELKSLEDHLFQQGELVSREQFEKAFGKEPLGKFVRRIIGMDINAAKKAFGEFLSQGHLNSKQIRFIDTIINFLSVNGTIDPEKLFEPPFTDIDSGGIISLFDREESDQIREIIERVNGSGGAA